MIRPSCGAERHRHDTATLPAGSKTYFGILPQSRTLEAQAVDNPRCVGETGRSACRMAHG
jgi:hypothetical protein